MIDETSINPYMFQDLRTTQAYKDFMKKMEHTDGYCYKIQYNHSILDSDNVNDSIKVKILYNELMKLKAELSNTERILMGEINYLNADHRRLVEENKRLSDEIASIKQALYFG